MRILFIHDHGGGGGIVSFSDALIDELRGCSDFEVEVCYVHNWGSRAERLHDAGVPVHYAGVRSKWDVVNALNLTRIIQRGAFDVVDVHALHPVVRLAIAFARPRVHIYHEHGDIAAAIALGKRFSLWFGRLMRNSATRYVALGQNSKENLVRHFGISPDKVTIIHVAVDLEKFNPMKYNRTEARARFGIDSLQPVVGTTRALYPKNGVDHIVRAAVAILRQFPDTVFLIAGDGPWRNDYESLAQKMGVAGSFRFVGWMNDVAIALASMDVFVLPSMWEGTSVSALEAQCMGLPVVAYDVGGSRETFVDGITGTLLSERSPELLAQAVVDLLSDPGKLAEIGVKARARIRDQYDIAMVVKQYEELFRTLCDAGKVSSAPRVGGDL